MGFVNRWKGKYVKIDPKNPAALGVCDDSGFTFNHKDLVKQMEWRGNNLVWTGLMVGKPYLNVPNEQFRPPLVKDDPRPVKNPRPPYPYTDPETPVVDPFPQILDELEEGSFYSDNTPPNYVLPYSDENTPGWQDPSPVPPYSQLLIKLRKIHFQ